MNKAVFLDRDNTIVNDPEGYLYKVEKLEFLSGAIDGLRRLQENGYLLIVVTNQSGIGRGKYTEQNYFRFRKIMHERLKKEGIEITAEYFCPHHPEAKIERYRKQCKCRKPETKMFDDAKKEYDIDFSKSWVVGDKSSDVEVGSKIGARRIGVLSREDPNGTGLRKYAEFVARNLEEAADYILENG